MQAYRATNEGNNDAVSTRRRLWMSFRGRSPEFDAGFIPQPPCLLSILVVARALRAVDGPEAPLEFAYSRPKIRRDGAEPETAKESGASFLEGHGRSRLFDIVVRQRYEVEEPDGAV